MNHKKLKLVILVVILGVGFFGCSKKEPAPEVVPEAAQQAAQLPELEQNKIYQTNQPEWAKNPDTSFTDSPDHLEKPSEEDELFKEPAGD